MLILHETFGSPNNLNMEALSFMMRDYQTLVHVYRVLCVVEIHYGYKCHLFMLSSLCLTGNSLYSEES